jgi:ADP-ribose pyrophosphatase YjhB (NUDIX family)
VEPQGDYVSFSEIPVVGDIRANEVTLVFDARAIEPQLEQVQYTEEWYNEHPDQAAYVAGEGWQEQYTEPEECYDVDEESGWEERDDECLQEHWRAAELESFLFKSDEREWVSRGDSVDVAFSPNALKEILVADPRQIDAVEAVLDETHFDVKVGVREAGVRTAASPDRCGAGVLFTDGTRILLVKRTRDMDHPHTWVVPGGACEPGENVSATAYRETHEEVGSVPHHAVIDWYVLESPFDEKQPPQFTTFVAHVDPAVADGFLAELDHECAAWGWFNHDEVEQLELHPGVQTLLERMNPFYGSRKNHTAETREELEQLPVDILDHMAFGITEGIHELPLRAINIKYETDYQNAVAEIQEGHWAPEEGIEDEPVDVSLERGIYWLEDGHHRYVAFELADRPTILADVTIKDNPVRVLMQKRTSENATQPRTAAWSFREDGEYAGVPKPMDPSLGRYVDKLTERRQHDKGYQKRVNFVLKQIGRLVDIMKKRGGAALPDAIDKVVTERDDAKAKLEALQPSIDQDPRGAVQKMVAVFDDFYGRVEEPLTQVKSPGIHKAWFLLDAIFGPHFAAAEQMIWGLHNWAQQEAERMKGRGDEDIPSLVKDLPGEKSLSEMEQEPSLEATDARDIQVPPSKDAPAPAPAAEEPVPLTKVKQPGKAPGAPAVWPTQQPAPSAPGAFQFNPQVLKKLFTQRTT